MSDEQRRRPQVRAPRTSLVDSAWDEPGARAPSLSPPRAAVATPALRSEESVTEEIDDLLDLRDDEPEGPLPPPAATQARRKASTAPVRGVGLSNDEDLFESALTGAAPNATKPMPRTAFQTRIGMGTPPAASPLPRFGSDPTESAPELEILDGPLPRFDSDGAQRALPSAARRDVAHPRSPSATPPPRDAAPFRPPSAPPPPRPPSAAPTAFLASPQPPAASLVTAPLGSGVGDFLAPTETAERSAATNEGTGLLDALSRPPPRAALRSLSPRVKMLALALAVVAALAGVFIVFRGKISGFLGGVSASPKSSAPVASAVSSQARVAASAAPVASVAPQASAVASASKKPVEPPAQAAPARPVATARAADLAELEGLKQHTAQQALALSNEHSADRVKAVRELGERLARDSSLIGKPEVIEELRGYAAESETARDALAALAVLPGPVGSDLLYDVWTRTPKRTPITELAEALNYAKDVRPRASPALAVALDLRRTESCPAVKAILPRAKQHADRRAVVPLVKLMSKRGCGPTKRDDCFACLGKRDEVRDAITAARARKEPKY